MTILEATQSIIMGSTWKEPLIISWVQATMLTFVFVTGDNIFTQQVMAKIRPDRTTASSRSANPMENRSQARRLHQRPLERSNRRASRDPLREAPKRRRSIKPSHAADASTKTSFDTSSPDAHRRLWPSGKTKIVGYPDTSYITGTTRTNPHSALM